MISNNEGVEIMQKKQRKYAFNTNLVFFFVMLFIGNGRGMPVYEIAYPHKEKYPFFVNATIARNRKTTKLIKKYYKRNIEDLR